MSDLKVLLHRKRPLMISCPPKVVDRTTFKNWSKNSKKAAVSKEFLKDAGLTKQHHRACIPIEEEDIEKV
jgi:hypothetical protein